jgi:hypothetical protein
MERSEFFFRYAVNTLASMPTRTLARPVVLLLANGFMHSWFQKNPDASAPPPNQEHLDYGALHAFVPQRKRALRRFKIVATCGTIAVGLAFAYLISLLFR